MLTILFRTDTPCTEAVVPAFVTDGEDSDGYAAVRAAAGNAADAETAIDTARIMHPKFLINDILLIMFLP